MALHAQPGVRNPPARLGARAAGRQCQHRSAPTGRDAGAPPSSPRRHRHPAGPGRRTSLAPSRLPLARPAEPPRRAGQSRGKGTPPPPPLPPLTSDSARGCREAGAGRPAPSRRGGRPPPPCPGPAPRESGRLGAAPRLPQKPAGAQAGGCYLRPLIPPKLLWQARPQSRAAPLREAPTPRRGRIRLAPADRRRPSPGKRLALVQRWGPGGGGEKNTTTSTTTPSLPVALTLRKIKFSTPSCSRGTFCRRRARAASAGGAAPLPPHAPPPAAARCAPAAAPRTWDWCCSSRRRSDRQPPWRRAPARARTPTAPRPPAAASPRAASRPAGGAARRDAGKIKKGGREKKGGRGEGWGGRRDRARAREAVCGGKSMKNEAQRRVGSAACRAAASGGRLPPQTGSRQGGAIRGPSGSLTPAGGGGGRGGRRRQAAGGAHSPGVPYGADGTTYTGPPAWRAGEGRRSSAP